MPPFGLPRDMAPWIALGLALAMLALGRPLVRAREKPALFVAIAALAAAALSAVYGAVYLRGGPRIIDATSYYLEARGIAEGYLAWPLAEPETSALGRFLVRAEGASGAHLAVIFPPGYPAVLALGFLVGAPMLVGPVIAAGIVIATWDLASSVARDVDVAARKVSIPALAVLFSVTCAALRYHTADTMSHGLAALSVSSALALAFRAIDAAKEGASRRALVLAAGAGFAAGWLTATRPVSGLALGVVLAAAIISSAAPRLRVITALAIGALPGIALLLAHQRAATGAIGLSSQRLYYALSDGPPGCFRYGFGSGIGCLGEHGDFVRSRLPDGFGVISAAGTTLRRLKAHLVDAGNLELLALLVPAGAAVGWKAPRVRLLALAVGAQILAYAPFYFDGNYPAGGGRFFADVLPIEHVLAAVAVAHLAARARDPRRWAAGAVALALAGFAVRAGFDHAQLRDREGGRPMFEPTILAAAGVTRGLVFFDTDHGFDLAFDPAASVRRDAASGGLEALRFHGDALDRLAWEARGRPPAYRYRFGIPSEGPAEVSVEPLVFDEASPAVLAVEGESLWPPRDQEAGWALPEHAAGSCATAGRWLGLHAERDDTLASARLGLPAEPFRAAGGSIAPRAALGPGARGEIVLEIDGATARGWPLAAPNFPGAPVICVDLPPAPVPAGARRIELTLRRGPPAPGNSPIFALDRVNLTGAKSIDR